MHHNNPSISTQTEKPGFFYGNIIVIVSFIIILLVIGANYCFGVFFKPLINEFNWSRSAISGAYSVNMFLFGILSIFAGRLIDRFNCRIIVTLGGFFCGLSYLLMSQINDIWQVYLVYGVLLSVGKAAIVTPLLSNVARWFTAKRGLATGIVVAGSGFGIVFIAPLAEYLISTYSWQTSYIIFGWVILALVVIFAQFLKPEPGKTPVSIEKPANLKIQNQNLAYHEFSLGEVLRTRQFWIICLAGIFAAICVQTMMVHLVPYATDIKITPADAAILLSVIGWISILGKIGLGSLVDRHGNKLAVFIILGSLLFTYLWIQFASGLWMFYLLAVVFSIGYGGEVVVKSTIVAEYFGLRAHGAFLGLIMFTSNLGSALGPLLAGGIFDLTGSYHWAFILCILLSVTGMTMLLFLKPLVKKA